MKKNECKLDIRLRIKIRFSFMGFWGFANRTLTHDLQQARTTGGWHWQCLAATSRVPADTAQT